MASILESVLLFTGVPGPGDGDCGAGDGMPLEAILEPCSLAAAAAALALASAMILLMSGFPAGGTPLPSVAGAGDPLFERTFFWMFCVSSSGCGRFRPFAETSAMTDG